MPNFDGTIDSRWRPDLASSRRRVREELEEARGEVRFSRELAPVPGAYGRTFEAHDAQTRALIRRLADLEVLPHGHRVSELVSEWQWRDKMHAAVEKQRYLEPMMEAVRRDPVGHEHLMIFLLLVFEPVRRSVSRAFVGLRMGLTPREKDAKWTNRAEARMIRQIEREQLYDVTREAALEALFRYPVSPPPPNFFGWLRETIAHRALDKLTGDLCEVDDLRNSLMAAEADALSRCLAGFDELEGPPMRDRNGLRAWRAQIHMRDVFDVVEEFFAHDPVRDACATAVGRLPRAQREVVEAYFYEERKVPELARRRHVSQSTVYNQKRQARKTLFEDDVFFSVLYSLGEVRNRARARALATMYPDGRLPDGRRIVVIDDAA